LIEDDKIVCENNKMKTSDKDIAGENSSRGSPHFCIEKENLKRDFYIGLSSKDKQVILT
jgi:hypothetical protein